MCIDTCVVLDGLGLCSTERQVQSAAAGRGRAAAHAAALADGPARGPARLGCRADPGTFYFFWVAMASLYKATGGAQRGRHSYGLYSYSLYSYMAYIGMAYIVMAYIVAAYMIMADIVMAYIVLAYLVMAHVIMASIVMAYIVMAPRQASEDSIVWVRGPIYLWPI